MLTLESHSGINVIVKLCTLSS